MEAHTDFSELLALFNAHGVEYLVVEAYALAWSVGMVYLPRRLDPPMMTFSAVPLAPSAFKRAELL